MTATQTLPPYFDLGATPSYFRRRAGWFAGESDHADNRLGTLRLVIQVGKHPGDRDQIDEYGVQEDTDESPPYPGSRSFILENDDDPDDEGPFRCVVGSVELCGCEMGRFDRKRETQTGCKHRDALKALVAEGVFKTRRRTRKGACMTRFTDGPAHDRSLSLARSPIFLRVTKDADGSLDALDQLNDEPRPTEEVTVYVFVRHLGTAHIDYRDEHGRRRGRWEQMAEYRLYETQPDDETMRDTQKWRAWCTEQAKLQPQPSKESK